jgi:hypothetical protein
MNIGLPMMSRDMLLRAYGADCLASHGKIIIFGKQKHTVYMFISPSTTLLDNMKASRSILTTAPTLVPSDPSTGDTIAWYARSSNSWWM